MRQLETCARISIAMEEDILGLGSSRKHLCCPKFGFSINPLTVARCVPKLTREIPLDFGTSDKVFSSQWLSETELLIGTKCNKVKLCKASSNVLLLLKSMFLCSSLSLIYLMADGLKFPD